MFKHLLMLSDTGSKNLNQAIIACTISNLMLMLPFIVLIQIIMVLLKPITNNETLNIYNLWGLLVIGFVGALIYLFFYKREYKKTYESAYQEAASTRIEVAERIRKLPLSFFNRKDLSELTANIMGDCASIETVMSHVVPQMIGYSISSAIACVLMAIYDWRMAQAVFCALPMTLFIVIIGRKVESSLAKKHVEAKLEVSDQVQEYIDGIKVVKAFGLSGQKFNTLNDALKKMMWASIKFEGIAGIFVSLSSIVLQTGLGVVVLIGVNLMLSESLNPIVFLAFVIVSARIYGPLLAILFLLPEFFYMLISTQRMRDMRLEPIMEGKKDVMLNDFSIKLENISFAYNQEDVISNLSCFIPQGKITALVGPSGSGKSTLSLLIARFWDVKSGRIIIDKYDIKDIDPETLMKSMSFVFQNVVLFDDTILNNIRLGRYDATDDEVKAIAKLARCEEFVNRFPQGWNTMIGENGSKLSGGERQRISIDRALLKDAPIVLLDEATSSLDPENEIYIQEAILELVKNRTVIVIAHRLKTIASADQIIVLDNGKIIEQGDFQKLINNQGLFARLYKIQQEKVDII